MTTKRHASVRPSWGKATSCITAAIGLFAVLSLPAKADIVSLTAAQDTLLTSSSFANDNNGGSSFFAVGTSGANVQVSPVRFDVSPLDGLYSTINSITLRVYVEAPINGGLTANLFAITDANRAWVEGTAIGTSQVGSSSWNSLAWAVATGDRTPWAGTGGLSTAGTDYVNTVLASQTFANPPGFPDVDTAVDFTFTGTPTALTALIDAWMVDNVTNSQANPGLLFRPTSSPAFDRRFRMHSKEAVNSDFHPQLIVEFTPVPEPPVAAILLAGFGGVFAMLRRRRRA